MKIEDFDYDLPAASIAQVPPARREDARLLVMHRDPGQPGVEHAGMSDLPGLLQAGDLLVLNDTRVLPARLDTRRDTGGRVEVFLLEPGPDNTWSALVRAGGSPQPGEVLTVGEAGIELVERLGDGMWRIRGRGPDCLELAMRHGRMPLPPYIERAVGDGLDALDRDRYQTVYAREEGAVAAPTAGLHLTPALFDALEAQGVERAFVTLHVGLGTFTPVRTDRLEDHAMHAERFHVSESTAVAVRVAKAEGRRVIAVGTTSVRALEGAAARSEDGSPKAGSGRTNLFITPGFPFRVVDGLLTNFHLPRSTLLALVSALAGRERVLDAYRTAVAEGYRFYSYGDAMLIL